MAKSSRLIVCQKSSSPASVYLVTEKSFDFVLLALGSKDDDVSLLDGQLSAAVVHTVDCHETLYIHGFSSSNTIGWTF